MNDAERILEREALNRIGRYPPKAVLRLLGGNIGS
jgi:hypothetical protein